MDNNNLKRLWLATRIWLAAVVINAALGTLYLTDFAFGIYTGDLLGTGLLFGSLFSFPVMLIIMVVMKRCMKAEMNGLNLFWGVLITGILMSVIMFLIFCCFIRIYGDNRLISLMGTAVLSGITAVAIHCRPLLKLGNNVGSVQEKTDK